MELRGVFTPLDTLFINLIQYLKESRGTWWPTIFVSLNYTMFFFIPYDSQIVITLMGMVGNHDPLKWPASSITGEVWFIEELMLFQKYVAHLSMLFWWIYHSFEIYTSHCREKRQGTLTIDQSDSVTSVSVSGATQLDTDGFLWLGGSPAPPRGLPLHYYLGFTGCIESVSIEDEALNLVQNRVIHGSVEFCPLWGSAYIVTWLDRSHDYLAVAMWLL